MNARQKKVIGVTERKWGKKRPVAWQVRDGLGVEGDDKGLKYWPHPNTQSAPRVLLGDGPLGRVDDS